MTLEMKEHTHTHITSLLTTSCVSIEMWLHWVPLKMTNRKHKKLLVVSGIQGTCEILFEKKILVDCTVEHHRCSKFCNIFFCITNNITGESCCHGNVLISTVSHLQRIRVQRVTGYYQAYNLLTDHTLSLILCATGVYPAAPYISLLSNLMLVY